MANYRDEVAPWITSYKFSVGSLEDIARGIPDKTVFEEVKTGTYKDLLQNNSSILLPTVLGVYQQSEIAHETPDKKEERQKIEDLQSQAGVKMLLRFKGIEDNMDPNLINIAYDPSVLTEPLIRELLGDELKRTTASPIGKLPNFYDKPIDDFYKLIADFMGNIDQKDMDFCRDAFERMKKPAEDLFEKFKLYGLTRMEYLALKLDPEISTDPRFNSDMVRDINQHPDL
ncbi:hypothetical protein CMI42_02105 [Candidatus Pacearchaeota archaeon]|nr:hypothetical protein [Candidatus Pacearchaeota archaeon]|tara:strand:+ start:1275 stop:1961 length:687 start_codon:yes stop_codon:yes gene_type:complete